MDRIAHLIVARSRLILAATAICTLVAAGFLFRISLDADVTGFLVEGNERGRAYQALLDKYEARDPIMVLLERSGGFTTREGALALLDARAALAAVPGVERAATFLPEVHPLTGRPLARADLEALPEPLLARLAEGPGAFLLSADGTRTLVVVNPGGDPVEVAGALLDVELALDAAFAGNPVVYAQLVDMLSWFLLGIPPVVIFLLLLVFTAQIGHPKLAALSILPAAVGSVRTFGLVCALGYEVDIIVVIVPIFVVVMGSADGLHFVTHLQEARDPDPEARTARALREVGVPMILTTVSTAVGFLSLLATDVGPMRQLGVFVAVGITFAGVVSFFTLPALLSRIAVPEGHPRAVGKRLTRGLQALARRRWIAGLVVAGLLAFAAATAPSLKVSTDQLFVFKDDHPARAAFAEVAEVFGGATPLFAELAVDEERPLREQLDELRAAQAALSALPGIERTFSLLDVVDEAPPGVADALLAGERETPLGKMVSPGGLRVAVFPRAFTSDDLQGWLTFAAEHDRVRILTGVPVLFDELARVVLRAQVSSLGVAFVLVAVMLLLAYRRLRPTLASLVPLAVTVAVLLGFLALSGIHLNLLTAVASSIVIGVGIDYAIHLVAAIDHARQDGPGYALRGLDAAGRPILANALGVAVGLSALFLSPLAPHTHIALIMWVSMTTAALTALLVIPALAGRDATAAPSPDA